VKEAIFSILAARVGEACVLDCFAGSGALGFEAISRGAATVTFIEAHAPTARALKIAAATLGIEPGIATILTRRAEQAVPLLRGPFDLVFADPPYSQAPPLPLFDNLRAAGLLAPDALIIYEHAAGAPAFETAPFTVLRRAAWGEVGATFLIQAPPASEPAART
jgi:16S rRNA (guanine966-N2)-methyltransferase